MREDYRAVLRYIEKDWANTTHTAKKNIWGNARNLIMHFARIKLPHPSVAPNQSYFAGTQFYWDTYFTVVGLVTAGKVDLAKAMVDNLLYLFPKFKLIPARNSWTSIGRTQPPFLTRMAFEVYDAGGADDDWLDRVMEIAKQEYEKVWRAYPRLEQSTGLSRYRPRYLSTFLTTYESGWDVSSRFKDSFAPIPVDLNCLLFTYEADLLKYATKRQDTKEIAAWKQRMIQRRKLIEQFFWDSDTGFYYDYNRKTLERQNLKTLAGFFPLWCGAASDDNALRVVKRLKDFEHAGGLATTEKMKLTLKQWDYPNGWAPLHLIVVEGLRRYGFHEDADRIARKWLDCNARVFSKTGRLWEKYDVRNMHVGRRGRYPTQPGFAWTDGVFIRLLKGLREKH